MTRFRFLVLVAVLCFSAPAWSQSWHYTGSLSEPKMEFTTTALDNGTVLVTGGMNSDSKPHSECEVYNPATASWSPTAPLSVARILHTAVKLADGRVAVFGGQIAGTYDGGWPVQTAQVEIYDPSTGTWSDGGSLQLARQHHTSTLLSDGRVLIVGGLNGATPSATAEIYDPATMTSKYVASMQLARYEGQATALSDGRVMVNGGRNGGWNGNYFSETEIYDPTSDTWTVVESSPQAHQRAILVQFSDGSVLAAAGRNSPTSSAPGSELFDLTTGHWTQTDPMKVPVTWMAPVLFPDDRYLVTGGFYDAAWSSSSTDVTCTPTAEWYDKGNARWYYAPDMEQERGRHGAAYIHQTVNDELPTDMILVVGGITGNNTYTATSEYLDVTQQGLNAYKAMAINQQSSGVADQHSNNVVSVVYDGLSPVLRLSMDKPADGSVQLISMDGKIVGSYDLQTIPSGTFDFSIGSAKLASGAYTAVVRLGAVIQHIRFIVAH